MSKLLAGINSKATSLAQPLSEQARETSGVINQGSMKSLRPVAPYGDPPWKSRCPPGRVSLFVFGPAPSASSRHPVW
jgi:hypothetical protein